MRWGETLIQSLWKGKEADCRHTDTTSVCPREWVMVHATTDRKRVVRTTHRGRGPSYLVLVPIRRKPHPRREPSMPMRAIRLSTAVASPELDELLLALMA